MHIIEIGMEKDVLKANVDLANKNLELLKKNKIKCYDFMGAIGSGKTLMIERLTEKLLSKGKKVGAITGDVAGMDDYNRLKKFGIEAENINTKKECHLDAHLIHHSLHKLNLENIDILFIENVGNLVCPADFPLGSSKRVVIISVTEGDDMVRKHPIIFGQADVVVVNKKDLAEYVDVNIDTIIQDYKRINPNGKIVVTNAKNGEGIDELMEMLEL